MQDPRSKRGKPNQETHSTAQHSAGPPCCCCCFRTLAAGRVLQAAPVRRRRHPPAALRHRPTLAPCPCHLGTDSTTHKHKHKKCARQQQPTSQSAQRVKIITYVCTAFTPRACCVFVHAVCPCLPLSPSPTHLHTNQYTNHTNHHHSTTTQIPYLLRVRVQTVSGSSRCSQGTAAPTPGTPWRQPSGHLVV